MIYYLVFALTVGVAFGNLCADRPDGYIPSHGCKSYTVCFSEQEIQIDCPGDTVFNEEEGACTDPEGVPAPCGLWRDCEGRTGQFADLELDCTAYYTCNGGVFMGHIECAEGTVFDDRTGACTWPFLVPPPCGTCETC